MIKGVELGLCSAVSEKYGYDVKSEADSGSFIRDVASYWVFQEYFNATQLAVSLVSGTDALMSVTYDNTANDDKVDNLVDFVDKTTSDLLAAHGLQGVVSHGVTGLDPFATAILDGIADDLHVMDEAVLPLAMLILSAIIGSVTLMIIPLFTILVTILAEFLVMYPVALSMEVVSFTPSLMMSITIAMSIDYSLFLLSRFMEEINKGRSVEEAIPYMVDGAGHTILVSGGTLICCFLGMLIFPMAMLQSVGIGASVTLFFALSVNLSLTPALLYSIGKELVEGQEVLERCWRRMLGQPPLPDKTFHRLGNGGSSGGTNGGGGSDGAMMERASPEKGVRGEEGGGGVVCGDNNGLSEPLMSGHDALIAREDQKNAERAATSSSSSSSAPDPPPPAPSAAAVASSFLHISSKSETSFGEESTNLGDDSEHSEEFGRDLAMSESAWYALAWFLLNPWPRGCAVLAATCALVAPVCVYCLSVDVSISFDMSVPSGAKTYDTFQAVEDSFGAGAVFPYSLLVLPQKNATTSSASASSTSSASTDPCAGATYAPGAPSLCTLAKAAGEVPPGASCSNGFMCQDAFDALGAALSTLASNGDADSEIATLVGITSLNGTTVTYADYVTALERELQVPGAGALTSFDSSILLLYESFCSATNTTTSAAAASDPTSGRSSRMEVNLCAATYYSVILAKDPYSSDGVAWLKKARRTLHDLAHGDSSSSSSSSSSDGSSGPFDYYLAYGAGMTYDVSEAVYNSFPLIVGVTLATVFVLMGCAFGSVVVPIRSVLTLALTLSFVFGLLVLVYQHGAFSFLGLRCLSNSGGVDWLPPVMSFSIIVGLGLDYDVFLISRVYEYRLEGNTDHASAVKGICSTGYIITAAGLIMAVAFGGLFTSEELILNQSAFLLVFAVLLDTFVVRTLCVPALLGITDTLSWWPSNLPPATKSIGL